jgi:hypothetical protein
MSEKQSLAGTTPQVRRTRADPPVPSPPPPPPPPPPAPTHQTGAALELVEAIDSDSGCSAPKTCKKAERVYGEKVQAFDRPVKRRRVCGSKAQATLQ